MKLKIIIILISVIFKLCNGQFAGGSGTAEDPYQVATAEHLNNVRDYLESHFIQTADIDLGVPPWNEGEGWEPIGYDYTIAFKGVYDGRNYLIQNLIIRKDSLNNVGLFGCARYSTFRNIYLTGADILGYRFVGILVGRNINTLIENCHTTGQVFGFNNEIGGIVGSNYESSKIILSSFQGNIKGYRFVGGIAGSNSLSEIVKTFSVCVIEGSENVGCLSGDNSNSNIDNCYSYGEVIGTLDDTGGLIGYNKSSTVSNSYSTSLVSGESSNKGGLIGYLSMSTTTSSYWDIEASGIEISAGGEGRTTDQMTNSYSSDTCVDWDFENIWADDVTGINNGYPILQWQLPQDAPGKPTDFLATAYPEGGFGVDMSWANPVNLINGEPLTELSAIHVYRNFDLIYTIENPVPGASEQFTDLPVIADYYTYKVVGENSAGYGLPALQKDLMVGLFFGGSGTKSEPYLVANADHLNNVRKYLSSYYLQISDIDLAGSEYESGWVPIGSYKTPFNGNYNGNGHKVNNVTVIVPNGKYLGFFSYVNRAEVYDLKLENVNISGFEYIGGFVGTAVNSNIHDCGVTGSVSGTGDYIGGFAGNNFRSRIEKSYSHSDVTGNVYTGVFVGFNYNSSKIYNCYSRGNVAGNDYVGGFSGGNTFSTIQKSYSAVIVNSSGACSGGFSGSDEGNDISVSYWDKNISGMEISAGGFSRSTSDMTYPYDSNTYVDWDFSQIWQADTDNRNGGYPYLSKLGTGIQEEITSYLPNTIQLFQNYPNPFNPVTSIEYSILKDTYVSLFIFNTKGETVKRVFENKPLNTGKYSAVWDGRNDTGQSVSAGVYFIKLFNDEETMIKQAVLVK
ncbi:MAG: GLUG motif-containing protein [Candidatus Delongbacteria bacterium]|nr:GLUG motif-containing protein [Candidatus Delongbacteria bacterium]